jgi:aminoglycoside/choline kinase family phosphotransferase
MEKIIITLKDLFCERFAKKPVEAELIPGGASERKIFRLKSGSNSVIGIFNTKVKENIAFIEFSKIFKKINLNVPEIYIISKDNKFYLEQDLGDVSLFTISSENKIKREKLLEYYERALSDLLKFQIAGYDKIDFNHCYETKIFDKYQIAYDFNKFRKYYFLKFINDNKKNKIKAGILSLLTDVLISTKYNFFMYRDFQPRNVMVKNNILYYIDYQSGRIGPPHYDVASLLYSGSQNLIEEERYYLLNHYIKLLRKKSSINKSEFISQYYYFVVIRLLQVLGSYGFLLSEKKDKSVLNKIEKAKKNIRSILPKIKEDELKNFLRIVSE